MAPEVKLLAEWFWTDRWMGSSAFLLPIGPRGLYREMLTQAWRRGARLPNNHEVIRRAVGCTLQEWNRCWPSVQGYWRVEGDSLVNDTQVEVYTEALGIQQRASARGKKGAQARAQALAQAEREKALKTQPPSPSPTPTVPPERAPEERVTPARAARGMGAGVMAGSLPREHLSHAFCGRKCVPNFLHGEFVQSVGGADPEGAVKAFYADALEAIPDDVPIGDEPVKFWRAQFAARFGSAAPAGKTAGNRAAGERWLEQRRAAR